MKATNSFISTKEAHETIDNSNEKRRNVLFLSSWYPSRVHKTNGNFNEKFAQTLSIKHNVYVLHVVADKDAKQQEEIIIKEKGKLKTVFIYFKKKEHESIFDKLIKAYLYYSYYKKGFKLISNTWKLPEIVHNNVIYPVGLFALYLKKIYKIPYISSESWTGYLTFRDVKINFLSLFLIKTIAKKASFLCPVTTHLQQEMQQKGIGGNYKSVPNVVNKTVFFPTEDCLPTSTKFLHVSNCKDAHKNITGMLRSFDQLATLYPDIRLEIITEERVEDLEQIITNVGFKNRAQLFIKGRQPPEKIADAMRASTCFVLFSNFETFSVVIAEAWSCGIPAIYSKCGGLTELNNPEIGLQIKSKDETALFEAMKLVVEDNTRFNKSSILKQAEEYSETVVLQKFSEIYDILLSN